MVATFLIGIGGLLIAAIVVSLLTTETFHAEVIIPAKPEDVWAVLTDTTRYPEWNPVFVDVDGQYVEGAILPTKIIEPDGGILKLTSHVKKVEPYREIRQTGGLPVIMTFDHRWLLEPVEGGTKVTQHEVDRGGLIWFWDLAWVQPAYVKLNEALSQRVLEKR